MNSTLLIWDERFLNHKTGLGHPESPERLIAIKEILDQRGKLSLLQPRMATDEEISWVHTPELIDLVKKSRQYDEACFDADTPTSRGSADAAFLAAGGVITALDQVESGLVSNAFVFPRPPGHHAESNRSMGFCLFNNVAIGAEYLLKKKNKKRVAIVDIDVHHGNGTQHFFEERSDVFYISSHQYPFYPGTGGAHEKGRGAGEGFTLNLPLEAGSGDEELLKGYKKNLLPALEKYKPDFLIISAGFDAHTRDPLGGLNITQKGFQQLTLLLQSLAQKTCDGKIVFVLEGGYDKKGLQEGVTAVLETIS